jgi:hypothetical protein
VTTLAFSYVRFSSEKQKLRTSLQRQLDRAREYATTHNLTLDDHSYRDLAVCLTSTGDCQGIGSALFAPGAIPFWGTPYCSMHPLLQQK